MRSQQPVAGFIPRDHRAIAIGVLFVSALAWAYLFRLDQQMSSAASGTMTNMAMTTNVPWKPRDFLFTFAMWSVMMIGMMTPTAAPVLSLFSGIQARRPDGDGSRTILFGAGYLIVWFGFSAAAAMAQWGLHQGALLSASMSVTSARVGGLILIAAGAYQLTPAKSACLRQCQSPLGFLMTHWKDGAGGAFQMGMRHGVFCLGCCWALMCVLFVVGVMNLAWVAALTAFILIEKFGSGGLRIARFGGLAMVAFGVLVAVR